MKGRSGKAKTKNLNLKFESNVAKRYRSVKLEDKKTLVYLISHAKESPELFIDIYTLPTLSKPSKISPLREKHAEALGGK